MCSGKRKGGLLDFLSPVSTFKQFYGTTYIPDHQSGSHHLFNPPSVVYFNTKLTNLQ
uniref:Uncharacterized protein n=1 Tax=Arundo donax TaxID=35708 RepID=A0A0A8ZMB9_ARUDO